VFLVYACLSLAVYGRQALGDPRHVVEGFGPQPAFYGRDQSQFVWFLDWGARALTHLQNPLFTNALFAPRGYDLAWATSITGPAFLMAPVTLALGPIVSYDVLALAAPALAAWTAFLLCRQLTVRLSAAFAGGLLFGFGTYESAETINHLNLALVALLPLAALLVLRRHAGVTSRAHFILGLGLILALQLWTSSEVFASMVGFGAIAFTIGAVFGGRARWPQTRMVGAESLCALALAAVLGAPLLYYTLRYANPAAQVNAAGAEVDLANFVIPTSVTWLHGAGPVTPAAARLHGNITEQVAYFGLPLLVLLGCFGIAFRTRAIARCLVAFFLAAAIASLGSTAVVSGHRTGFALPWALADQLPLLRYASAARFIVYAWLAAAIVLAYWLDRRTRPILRWTLAALVLLSIAPNATGVPWGTRVDSPPLLAQPTLMHYVRSGSTVLALPFGIFGDSMYWQTQAHFAFRLAGGYVSASLPTAYRSHARVVHELEGYPARGDTGRDMCAFIRFTGSTVILLRDHAAGSWRPLLTPLRVAPAHAGGFSVYELGGVSQPRGACAARQPRPMAARTA
jgi:hypothetical protein